MFFIVISKLAYAESATWEKLQLDASASIDFPGKVTKQEAAGQDVYSLKEGKTIYMVLISKNGFRQDASAEELSKFYDGVVKGTLEAAGNGESLQQQAFTVAGFKGIEVQFTSPAKPQLPATKFMRALSVNGTMYTLNYWTNAEQNEESKADRNRFFASFQLRNVKNTAVTERSSAPDNARES
ncbi:MAG: hypothetical protein EOO63_15060, partial [Hymenobacter sp.]